MLFYEHRASKPWWYGSIPLASFDYLRRVELPAPPPKNIKNYDYLKERHETETASARADSASTEEEYLRGFPDQINMVAPNLLWLKFRSVGIPGFAGVLYVLAAIAVAVLGAAGLLRSARHFRYAT